MSIDLPAGVKKPRAALTAFLALTRAAAALGWDAIAATTGRAARTVQNWSDPDTSAQVAIGHAIAIDRACIDAGEDPHLYRWYGQMLDLHEAGRRRDQATIARSAATAAKEFGDAQAATIAAVAPGAGHIELLLAERETAEAYEALGNTLHDIRAAAHPEEGSPS